MCHSISWHSVPLFLCALAKKTDAAFHGMSHHAVALFFMPQPSLSCCGHIYLCHSKKQCTKAFCAIILSSTARNDMLLHSMALCIMLQHGVSRCGIVHCAMAMFCCHATARIWGKDNQPVWCSSKDLGGINLCGVGCHDGIAAVVLALVVVVFLWRLLLCCCVFLGGTINLFGFGFGGMEVAVVGGVLCFCCFLPWHCTFLPCYFCA